MILPETVNDVRVPTLVMFGCEFVVTVPAAVAKSTFALTFAKLASISFNGMLPV
jgi:hypothetical protein